MNEKIRPPHPPMITREDEHNERKIERELLERLIAQTWTMMRDTIASNERRIHRLETSLDALAAEALALRREVELLKRKDAVPDFVIVQYEADVRRLEKLAELA